ncbi:ADP-ribosylation factor-like protein 16 [Merluccius polli]|uniref:ADP-ribosylation factor-like protein 16 n=1 Tax=Merluccius polli TaxID=89951 RepID=A0AA47MED4_MERPO|nr:ADP-ribosylation factor-like protein 16 [Merluccius polli]
MWKCVCFSGRLALAKRCCSGLVVVFNPLRLQLPIRDGPGELGEPPVTLPTVGTNLTDLTLRRKKVTVRELGGCMGPIWPSYFTDCSCVIVRFPYTLLHFATLFFQIDISLCVGVKKQFMVDSANVFQVSSSCIQLLSVLSAPPLRAASVLVIFNKRDLPCTMSLVEMKSLFRMDDIIASATQPITMLEVSARSGQGLKEVLSWLDSNTSK